MSKKNKLSCELVPKAKNGEDSILFKKLNELCKNRFIANLIYASYLQPGVADRLDEEAVPRDKNGEHRAIDVFKFFDGDSIKSELMLDSVQVAVNEGFSDGSNPVDFASSEEAYQKAVAFNNSTKYKGLVAYVIQKGNKFNIILDNRTSKSINDVLNTALELAKWDTIKDEFNKLGFDLNELREKFPELISPNNIVNFIKTLSALKFAPVDGLGVENIRLLLELNQNNTLVKQAYSRGWGNTAEVAQNLYNIIHDSKSPKGLTNFATNVLNSIKNLGGIEVSKLIEALDKASLNESYDDLKSVQKTLEELDERYNIEKEVIVNESKTISRYTDIISNAIVSVTRQIDRIKKQKGLTPRAEELEKVLDQLSTDLKSKKGTLGLASFLQSALNYLETTQEMLNKIIIAEEGLEGAKQLSDTVVTIQNLRNAYYSIVNDIANVDNVILSVALNQEQVTQLKEIATKVKNIFDSQSYRMEELKETAMLKIATNFLGTGTNALYNKSAADIVSMSEADGTITDYLYAIGRSSSTFISLMGAVIRDAQTERDKKLITLSRRIREATDILNKAGIDSSFMYEIVRDKDGKIKNQRIVSQYDWDKYEKERYKYSRKLINAGFKLNSYDYLSAMQEWEDNNTEWVIVDSKANRAEQFPIFKKDKDFQEGWSDAQRRYYNEMMQIKAEIDTMLPAYAKHQYLAPQRRISINQLVKESIRGERSWGDTLKRILERSNIFKVRQDDTNFYINGIYEAGGEGIASTGAYDNTILRQIPVFYVNKLKDQGDLDHDFSGAIQSLASTACNYSEMSKIKSICDTAILFLNTHTPVEISREDLTRVEAITTKAGQVIAKKLHKTAADSNIASMLNTFVLSHVYGVDKKQQSKWAPFWSNLVGYTSFKGLALNLKGGLTNKFVGVIQNIIMATRGQYFNMKDLIGALTIVLGENGSALTGALVGAAGGVGGAAIGLGVGYALGAKGKFGKNGKIMDILTGNKNSIDSLIFEYFDSAQETYNQLSRTRYHSHMFTRLFGSIDPMALYSKGEYWIHMMNTYAILLHEKVIKYDPTTGERKQVSLYSVLKRKDDKNNNSVLSVDDNVVQINGEKINDAYFDALRRRVRYCNQQCHGSMNKEDKGIIHNYTLGMLVMNFRQWLIEHQSRRYRQLHWDESIRDVDLSNFFNNTKVLVNNKEVKLFDALEMADSGKGDGTFTYKIKDNVYTLAKKGHLIGPKKSLQGKKVTDEVLNQMLNKYAEDSGWRRGFKTGALVTIMNLFKQHREYQMTLFECWDELSETQKADVKETLGAFFMFMSLLGLSFAMGDPDDHEGEWSYRLWQYVLVRCLFDERASTIPGFILEGKTILNSLVAASRTAGGLLYILYGALPINEYGFESDLYDYNEKTGKWEIPRIQRGPNKGEVKYWRNLKKYSIPFIYQIEQTAKIGEDKDLFRVFESSITR